VENIVELARKLGPAKLAAMAAVGVLLLVGLVFMTGSVSSQKYGVLFSELSLKDSGEIAKELDRLNIAYKAEAEGSTILVPEAQVNRIRMQLAEQGLPNDSVVGYEVFDEQSTLGATTFVQEMNKMRALEGELARTIRAIDQVADARVHLVIPKRELFQRDANRPTASIALKLKKAMNKSQVQAVQHLVASAVKDLKPSSVSIIDDRGNMLASGTGEENSAMLATAMDDRKAAIEQRLKNQIEQIVSTHVGLGSARVAVAADLNMTRTTQTESLYDPDGRVVRSTQIVDEANNSRQPSDNNGVTVGNEIPGAPDEDGNMAVENSQRNEEIVNYEISSNTRTTVKEAGEINNLSVSVVIDNAMTTAADGTITSTPRSVEELQKLEEVVKAAMGFNEDRGDTVSVQNLAFAASPFAEEIVDAPLQKQDYMQMAQIFAVLAVGGLAAYFVLRPLIARQLSDDPTEGKLALADTSGNLVGIADENGNNLVDPFDHMDGAGGALSEMLNSTNIMGELHSSSVAQIGEMVENNPGEAIEIVRHWIKNEEAAA